MKVATKRTEESVSHRVCPYIHIHTTLLSESKSSDTSPFPTQVLLQLPVNAIYIDNGLLLINLTILLQTSFLFLQSSPFSRNLSCPIFLTHLIPQPCCLQRFLLLYE